MGKRRRKWFRIFFFFLWLPILSKDSDHPVHSLQVNPAIIIAVELICLFSVFYNHDV